MYVYDVYIYVNGECSKHGGDGNTQTVLKPERYDRPRHRLKKHMKLDLKEKAEGCGLDCLAQSRNSSF
jgi:hypothetical protein